MCIVCADYSVPIKNISRGELDRVAVSEKSQQQQGRATHTGIIPTDFCQKTDPHYLKQVASSFDQFVFFSKK